MRRYRYETAGYTNNNGEVVGPRVIGQCLYTVSGVCISCVSELMDVLQDGGYVLRADEYGMKMDGECPLVAASSSCVQ
jgi:hypothetical protein